MGGGERAVGRGLGILSQLRPCRLRCVGDARNVSAPVDAWGLPGMVAWTTPPPPCASTGVSSGMGAADCIFRGQVPPAINQQHHVQGSLGELPQAHGMCPSHPHPHARSPCFHSYRSAVQEHRPLLGAVWWCVQEFMQLLPHPPTALPPPPHRTARRSGFMLWRACVCVCVLCCAVLQATAT